jgi:Tol biopolymer transport system component
MRTPIAALLSALVAASAAGAAPQPSPALWSVHADGRSRTLLAVLPADGVVRDRTAAGRLAVWTGTALVLEGTGGGSRVALPLARDPEAVRFSPDGTSLLFSRSSTLEVVGADGAGERVVARGAPDASWSRDGRSIVYVSGGDVDIVAAAGGTPRVLAHSPFAASPALSPDGRSVAYVCRNAAGGTLCVTGGGATRRYAHGGWDPLWSPDGRRIATWVAGNYNSGLAVVDLARRRVQTIAMPTSIGIDYVPLAWSPDGRSLAYERRCEGLAPCRIASYVRNAVTGATRRVSVDGLMWSLVRWRGDTLTYVTSP